MTCTQRMLLELPDIRPIIGFLKSILTVFYRHTMSVISTNSLALTMNVIYVDCRKAFDKISHARLKYKLKSNSIKGNYLNWISEFLKLEGNA